MTTELPDYRPTRAKLIFNPISGVPSESPSQLVQIISEMQAIHIQPEVFLVEPDCDLPGVVKDALERGVRLFVVSGGDGTIESVAALLAGTRAVLGLIPTGTANNVALSLGIPAEIPAAVRLLRTGRQEKVDIGLASCAGNVRPFLEVCSVGLLSALFPAADDIQRGNWGRIGDFLSTLVTSPPAEMQLTLDDQPPIQTQGHVVLVANMPYVGPNFLIGGPGTHQDGRLDVLVFADLSKLEVLSTMVQMVSAGLEDPRIQRYQVKRIKIASQPAMPIVADGVSLGEGSLDVSIRQRGLTLIANPVKPTSAAAGAAASAAPSAAPAEHPSPTPDGVS